MRRRLGLRWTTADQAWLRATAVLVRAASLPLPDALPRTTRWVPAHAAPPGCPAAAGPRRDVVPVPRRELTGQPAPRGWGYGGAADGASETGGDELDDLNGKVAVVTGGSRRHRRGIVEALLEQGVRVVIADVEASVLEVALKGLHRRRATCVASPPTSPPPTSVEALADDVFAREGRCHLLFNNAGETSGGGGRPWEQDGQRLGMVFLASTSSEWPTACSPSSRG